MGLNKRTNSTNYLSIIDGTLRQVVEKGTEGAIEREFERSDKTKGIKHELKYDSVDGMITSIKVYDSQFGKQLSITIKDDGRYFNIQLPVKSRYAIDLMKRLPKVDLEKTVEIIPFDFKDKDTQKEIRGVSLDQGGEKHKNFFYNTETEKQDLYDFPLPEGDTSTYDSDDWLVYFSGLSKFLVQYTLDNVATKLPEDDYEPENQNENPENNSEGTEYPEDEINPDDIPFN